MTGVPSKTVKIYSNQSSAKTVSPYDDLEETAGIQSAAANLDVKLQLRVDQRTGRVAMQILDAKTAKVIRQVSTEELLRTLQTFRDLKKSLFFKGVE